MTPHSRGREGGGVAVQVAENPGKGRGAQPTKLNGVQHQVQGIPL